MDYIDEGFNYENNAYPKADPVKAQDLNDTDFVETYKLFFDSCRAEENDQNPDAQTIWQKRLKRMSDHFTTKYGS